MLKIEKKHVKVISLAIAAVFLLSVAGLAVSQSGKSFAAAGSSSNIGVVNYQLLVQQHPDMAGAEQAFKAEYDAVVKDFEAKSATMAEKEKQQYYEQLQQRLNNKQQELIGGIHDKVTAAIKATADSKGLSVVLNKNNVVYGGQDITDEVMKKITGK